MTNESCTTHEQRGLSLNVSSSPRPCAPGPPPVGVEERRRATLPERPVPAPRWRAAAEGTLEWRMSMRMGLNTRLQQRGQSTREA